MEDEGIVAILGLVLLQAGGEVRIPMELIENGLPENSLVRVWQDVATDELIVSVVEQENNES